MGSLIAKEIIQSQVWIDPNVPSPPSWNYKYVYPITVFDAVRDNINDENSNTLREELENLRKEIKQRQFIIPGKPANFLLTYAGHPGAVGSIQISKNISWDNSLQSHDRIPTEKAVADFLHTLGLVQKDNNGNILVYASEGGTKTEDRRVRWSDIMGRPEIYNDLGMNADGFVVQKTITEAINKINSRIELLDRDDLIYYNQLDDHRSNYENPHKITIEQIGGVSIDALNNHIENFDNPHKVEAWHLHLENVNNTSDKDKPISNATQEALNNILSLINEITGNAEKINYIVNASYNQETGYLKLLYQNNSSVVLYIPINGLLFNITYDTDSKELLLHTLGGDILRTSLSELFIRYIGSTDSNVIVSIEGDQETGTQIIKAKIAPYSITMKDIAPGSITTDALGYESIRTENIKNLSITVEKIVDGAIQTRNIYDLSVTNMKINNRAVDGRTLFSSTNDNRILAVLYAGEDPVWTKINAEMINSNVIKTHHIVDRAITTEKINDRSVTTGKLDENAVETINIRDHQITNLKIANKTISGTRLIDNIVLGGTPRIDVRPPLSSNTNQVPDTRWVKDIIDQMVIQNDNLGDRIVDGRTIFSSKYSNRVLVVKSNDTDPIWDLINEAMIENDSIKNSHLKNNSVTSEKIRGLSIESRHISHQAIKTTHIDNEAVQPWNIYKADVANRVLASIRDNDHPYYTKVNREMLEENVISANQVEDFSIPLNKLITSPLPDRLLGVRIRNSSPEWMQAVNEMLGNRSVDGRVLFTSLESNRVLAVTGMNEDPQWMRILGDMIMSNEIKDYHIIENGIKERHLSEKIVDTKHIKDWTIRSNNIAPRAIGGIELFTSPLPNRVLAVTSMPYSNPDWLQITTDMIEDLAIKREKLFQSNHPYRVLGATHPGVPPEYLMITSDFIVDDSIIPQKLVHDFVLYGTPESTKRPSEDADNRQIPDTRWVRQTIANLLKEFNPGKVFGIVGTDLLEDRCVNGTKLFTHPHAPRVIGITHPNMDPEFILIEEDLIVNGAVTQNKLQRSITLMGSPKIEVRPPPMANDNIGLGTLIPDCQWVWNAINYRIGSGVISDGGNIPTVNSNNCKIYIINHEVTTIDHCNECNISILSQEVFTLEPCNECNISVNSQGTLNIDHCNDYDITVTSGLMIIDKNINNNESLITSQSTLNIDICDDCDISINPQETLSIEHCDNYDISIDLSKLTIDENINNSNGSSTKSKGILVIEPCSDCNISVNSQGILNIDHCDDYDITVTSGLMIIDKNILVNGNILLGDGSITTNLIANRSITADKLFTSVIPNRLLGVLESNTNPQYLQAVNEMLGNRSVDGRTLFTSDENNRILGVDIANSNPKWMKINYQMMGPNCIGHDQILDESIGTSQLKDYAVTAEKLAQSAIIDENRLYDNSVTTRKIKDAAIENSKIAEETITGNKLVPNIELPLYPTVPEHTSYSTRSLRNTILSPNPPSEGQNGDIWFRYN